MISNSESDPGSTREASTWCVVDSLSIKSTLPKRERAATTTRTDSCSLLLKPMTDMDFRVVVYMSLLDTPSRRSVHSPLLRKTKDEMRAPGVHVQ